MSKLKNNNLNELLKDIDKLFNIIDDSENKETKKLNLENISKKAEYLKKNLEKKYKKYLDTSK